MSTIETSPGHELDPVVAAATAGDESAFSELVHRYEAELHAHCYRMLRSHADSEDVTQETFPRAWRSRASFQGCSPFRVWLHRIATNSCLTALERRTRRREADRATDLTPSPTRLLEGIPATEAGPDDDIVSKESVELVLRALRHLPPAQRAVVFLRDVLGWSARDTAELLDTSLASVTSVHQRARAKLRKLLPERRLEWSTWSAATTDRRALLGHYLDTAERKDVFATVLPNDSRSTPQPELQWLGAPCDRRASTRQEAPAA
jgi:RNA polymerase sigma-70 factor, ECF subfamily